MLKSNYEWIVRVEFKDERSKHLIRKTEKGAVSASKKYMQRPDIKRCRIFKEVGSVRQLSIYEIEPEY